MGPLESYQCMTAQDLMLRAGVRAAQQFISEVIFAERRQSIPMVQAD